MEQTTQIFVSYSMRDKEVVDPYIKNLKKAYKLLLYDSLERPTGKIVDELRNMQRSANGTIVFWAKAATDDERVINELEIAYTYSKEPNSNKFIVIIAQAGLNLPRHIQGVTIFYIEKHRIDVIMDGIRDVIDRHVYGSSDSASAYGSSSSVGSISSKNLNVEPNRTAAVQTILREMGLYKGKSDGKLGLQTIEALKEFRGKYYLPVQGEIKETDIDEKLLDAVRKAEPLTPVNADLQNDNPAFWILRLRPDLNENTIQKDTSFSFEINKDETLATAEYDLFKKLKPGDFIVGFDQKKDLLICTFKIVKGLRTDEKHREIIEFKLLEKFDYPVGRPAFKADFMTFVRVTRGANHLYEISKELFESISEASKKPEDSQKEKERVKKPYENLFRPFYVTEGDHKDTQDQLQFENDINSFASVIALKKVKPPLAIGLFGKWGSGKSFFMEKLYQKIEKLTQNKTDEDSIQNVVQVKFNSWHYSDANLWASLITEIFDSLKKFSTKADDGSEIKKISDTLQFTTMQKAAMEAKRTELENNIRQLESERSERRKKLEDLSGIGLLKLIFSDEKVKEDIEKIGINASIEDLAKNKAKLVEYGNDLNEMGTTAKAIWNFMKILKGWRLLVFVLSILVIVGLVIVLPKFFPNQLQQFKTWLTATVATITGIVALFGNLIYPARKNIRLAKERLDSMQKTLDQRPPEASDKLNEKVNELKQVTDTLEYLNTKIDEAQKEIEDVRTGRKLLEFIEQRSRDENYSKQLGLISWIRKDFERLDDLLRKQHEVSKEEKEEILNPQKVTLKIDRIILYIDDLDRCKEETVVKVLEAIHLLLAFPLFVVIVGVDPRWLNNALSKNYKTLFGSSKSSKKNNREPTDAELFLSGAATSYDYLEKIFQIPFTLKPIDKTGRENLIEYLLKNEMKKPDILDKNKSSGDIANNLSKPVDDTKNVNADLAKSKTNNEEIEAAAAKKIAAEKEKKDLEAKKEIALTFTDKEKEFMQEISPLFGHTPRGINRYVNIYRIIKAHKSLKVEEEFSEDEFIPVLVILSVVVGYSVFAQKFVDKITDAKDELTFKKFIEESDLPQDVRKSLAKYLTTKVFDLPMYLFKKNVELISRFSFRTLIRDLQSQ